LKVKYFLFLLILIPMITISQNEVYATHNTPVNIIKVEGSLTGGVQNEDFILPESVVDENKTAIFMTFRHIGDSNEKEVYRSFELINSTAMRFYGSSNTPASNDAISFVGYIVEFGATSDMFSQKDSFTIAGGLSNQEFDDLFGTPVNTTSSFFQFHGQTANHADLTWGQEELARMRIINSTGFGYEPFDAPNSGDTIVRYQIIDLNNGNVLVQRGNVTMIELTALTTITPPIAINGSRTMLFTSHNIDGLLDADADEHSFTARIDGSNDIEFDRDDADCSGVSNCILRINWETVTFLDGSVYVQYLQFDDTIATGANVQQTGTVNFVSTPVNFTNSFATGTVHTPFGLGQARTASAPVGGWDRVTYTVELIDADTVDVVTNDGASVSDVWFQVIEFSEVDHGTIFNQAVTDTVSTTDQEELNINKTAVEFSSVVDASQNFNITKVGSDLILAVDSMGGMNVTKLLQDAVSNVDFIGGLNITKSFQDTVTTIDDVILNFLVIPPTPSGGGAPSSGGILGEPLGTPLSPVRLIGLSIDSEYLIVEQSDIVPSNFAISWFGDDYQGIKLTSIKPKEGYMGYNQWIQFSPTPELLEVSHETGFDNRLPTDPRSLFNTALNDFTLNIPSNRCTGDLVDVATSNCFNPIIYEVPLEFEFDVKGAKFTQEHILTIDGREVPKCVLINMEFPVVICDVIDFTLDSWWALILLGIVFYIIPKIFLAKGKRKVRVAHFISRRNDDVLDNSNTSKRLKRLKKVR